VPHFLILLEVCHVLPFLLNSIDCKCKNRGIIEVLNNIADGMGKHRDDIRNDARTAYKQWAIRVQEIRGKPRWKMYQTRSEPESKLVAYVLQSNK